MPAISTPMGLPWRLAIHAAGSVLIEHIKNAVIWRVDPAGVRTRMAGSTQNGADTGDGGLARNPTLGGAAQVAAGPDGSVHVATNINSVRRIRPDDIIVHLAGQIHVRTRVGLEMQEIEVAERIAACYFRYGFRRRSIKFAGRDLYRELLGIGGTKGRHDIQILCQSKFAVHNRANARSIMLRNVVTRPMGGNPHRIQ